MTTRQKLLKNSVPNSFTVGVYVHLLRGIEYQSNVMRHVRVSRVAYLLQVYRKYLKTIKGILGNGPLFFINSGSQLQS